MTKKGEAKFFKTLKFKGDRTKILGHYAHPSKDGWLGGDAPLIMTIEATIRKLKKMYPNLNFKEVNLIRIKIIES